MADFNPQGQYAFRGKGNENCIQHLKILDLVCETCEDLVCVECVTSHHKGHEFCSLKDVVQKAKEEINTFINNIEKKEIPNIQQAITALERNQEDLNSCLKECKNALQSGSYVSIYDVRNDVRNVITLNTQLLDHLTTAFGTITTSQGQVEPSQRTPEDRTQIKPKYSIMQETKVIEQLNCRWILNAANTCITCSTDDSQAYILDHDKCSVKRFTKMIEYQNDTLEYQNDIQVQYKVRISDVQVSATTQHIWTCSDEDWNVMECVPSKSPMVKFIADSTPYCLCVTVDNNVLIGMANQITKYTTQGEILLKTKSKTIFGQSIVKSLHRITECRVTQNVAIADSDKKDVLVMDNTFQEIFRYKGDIPTKYQQTIIKRKKRFSPTDVRYDSGGNLVISDRYKGVHLLSGVGEYLRLIYTDESHYYSIGIAANNVLWVGIGNCNLKIKILQYCDTDV